MELALYHPEHGYYSKARNPVGTGGDFVTSPTISPVFAYALARLVREFLSRSGDEVCSIVDIGCGDGSLLAQIASELAVPTSSQPRSAPPPEGPLDSAGSLVFIGIDRSLSRVPEERRRRADLKFATLLDAIPREAPALILCNELFDALPVARVVQRETMLRELMVHLEGGELTWVERPASPDLVAYFRDRGVALQVGQFADVTPQWGELYLAIARRVERGMIVTFDYGFETRELFDTRIRRYGTAGAFTRHQVHRDLLRAPGDQDLTAHINFSDLRQAGENAGFETLQFSRQAGFLLGLDVMSHPLFEPADLVMSNGLADSLAIFEQRQAAQRLILPDGIGEEMRVLVQGRNLPVDGWRFQRSPSMRDKRS